MNPEMKDRRKRAVDLFSKKDFGISAIQKKRESR